MRPCRCQRGAPPATGFSREAGIEADTAAAIARTISFAFASLAAAAFAGPLFALFMALDSTDTTSKIGGPLVSRFCFLPNKVGTMLDIVKLLSTRNAHVVALGIAEQPIGSRRIVVSDPETVGKHFPRARRSLWRLRNGGGGAAGGGDRAGEAARHAPHGRGEHAFQLPATSPARHGRAALALPVGRYGVCLRGPPEGEGFKMLGPADISS